MCYDPSICLEQLGNIKKKPVSIAGHMAKFELKNF
jgi:hypothetical protein